MKNHNKFILIFALISGLFYTQKALTHGANINYQNTQAINIKATYDSGEPIKNGQVTVYNPSDPAKPWLKGMTNEAGEFVFIPDYSITGNWQVKVRQAGHGTMINIPLNQKIESGETMKTESATNTSNNNVKSGSINNATYTTPQKLIMAGFGVWGCVGTALYFSKKKAEQ
jgi:nickel transport protein